MDERVRCLLYLQSEIPLTETDNLIALILACRDASTLLSCGVVARQVRR